MNWKRVLRIAVCLVLVCTLVVGISPIRAKAAYVPVFSDVMALGIAVVVLGMATGFIPPPNITTEPPVIYIDLGASRGSHYLGGQVPFLDLRWYAEYKPTVDTIISAFLWICFVWKMFLNLPGIISGMPGDFNAHAAESMGVAPYLPARSAEYEHIRVLNRRSMHRRE